jgi:hypothetical protein
MMVYHKKTANDYDENGNKLNVLFQILVDCPFCGDHSFRENVYGQLRYLPADGVIFGKTYDEDSNVKHFTSFKVKPNESNRYSMSGARNE